MNLFFKLGCNQGAEFPKTDAVSGCDSLPLAKVQALYPRKPADLPIGVFWDTGYGAILETEDGSLVELL